MVYIHCVHFLSPHFSSLVETCPTTAAQLQRPPKTFRLLSPVAALNALGTCDSTGKLPPFRDTLFTCFLGGILLVSTPFQTSLLKLLLLPTSRCVLGELIP